jgi:polyferredoxin
MAVKLVRRTHPDRSQVLRRGVQLAFLLVNLWIGVEFYLFVRYYETGGLGPYCDRPAGVEGWLPIASLMNLKVLLATGEIPRLHPAGMFLLIAFLSASWIFRKSFCSWLCPVGAVSEYLWKLGRSTFRRNFMLPRKLDVILRSLKYLLLGLFLYAVGSMSVEGIRAFLEAPYGIVDDVKMLNFFRFLGLTGGVVIAVLVMASVFVPNFWCRYLCPYGALMGIAALASPLRIRRNPASCIDCAKCANACPSTLPVDKLITIASAECTGCMECVASCPAADALFLAAPRGRRVPAWTIAVGTMVLFFGVVGYAKLSGHWITEIPGHIYSTLIPHASEFTHP